MGATEHWFYHLGDGGLQSALPPLLEKVLAHQWRALVCAPDEDALRALDQHLWTYRADSFLPHGLALEPRADAQPVLLSTTGENENGAAVVILLHGAPEPALSGVQRCMTMFDNTEQQALAIARKRWKRVRESGAPVSYWRQDEAGHWRKQDDGGG